VPSVFFTLHPSIARFSGFSKKHIACLDGTATANQLLSAGRSWRKTVNEQDSMKTRIIISWFDFSCFPIIPIGLRWGRTGKGSRLRQALETASREDSLPYPSRRKCFRLLTRDARVYEEESLGGG
jgi:hypothetical protein